MRLSWLLIALAIPLMAVANDVYVVNGAGDTVDVIDSVTDRVVQRIPGMEGAFGLAFSPDGNRVFISDEYKDEIYVVDRRRAQISRRIAVDGHPSMMAISKDGKRLFVNLQSKPPGAAIKVIDTTSLKVVNNIPMTAPMHDMCITEDGKFLVSGSDVGQFIVVIDLQTDRPVWNKKFDQRVYTIAIESHPDGSASRVFVQLRGLNGFKVIDFNTHEQTAAVDLPREPSGFLGRFGNPSHGIGISPDHKTVWVNSGAANSVFVFSLPDLKVIGRVPLPVRDLPGGRLLGAQPNWVTFSADGKKVYVT
ncbi:MAG: YncE family protein, partial [Terriglobales bacterium]